MVKKDATKLPSLKELDAMTVLDPNGGECTVLCYDLLSALEELEGTIGIGRIRLLARIGAIRGRMRELKCHPCLPR
jgi:hypothetical protein